MISFLDWIIKIGGVITALGIIFGLLWGALKLTLKPVVKKFETYDRHMHKNYMGILRLTIMSSEMPIGERIVAGQEYLDHDGNGEIKKFLEETFNITKTVTDAPHYKN